MKETYVGKKSEDMEKKQKAKIGKEKDIGPVFGDAVTYANRPRTPKQIFEEGVIPF